jgi:uncharacterized membrane protein YraQ (UPF0718 family)
VCRTKYIKNGNGGSAMSIFVSVLFYVVPALMIIWFMVSVVSALRRKNKILEAILEEMKKKN